MEFGRSMTISYKCLFMVFLARAPRHILVDMVTVSDRTSCLFLLTPNTYVTTFRAYSDCSFRYRISTPYTTSCQERQPVGETHLPHFSFDMLLVFMLHHTCYTTNNVNHSLFIHWCTNKLPNVATVKNKSTFIAIYQQQFYSQHHESNSVTRVKTAPVWETQQVPQVELPVTTLTYFVTHGLHSQNSTTK